MSITAKPVHGGGCECGAVRFEVTGPLRGIINCWCGQCRRLHGGAAPHTRAPWDRISFIEDRGVKWHRTSDFARRAFCGDCGARLFYQLDDGGGLVSISVGTLDQPTGLRVLGHIFVDDLPDSASIDDGLPRHATNWVGDQ